MRRTAPLTMSKSRPGHAVTVNSATGDKDVEVNIAEDTGTGANSTPESKSKRTKHATSAFTVMGLKPSPELISISMG